jgi:hypothetical protein
MRVGCLNRFQDSQQRSGTTGVLGYRLVDQQLFVSIQRSISDTLHDSSASLANSIGALAASIAFR